jgi:lipoate-protein ligase A
VCSASVAAQEQAWNAAQLAQQVVAPRWRFWHYEQPAIVLGCSQRALHERLHAAPGGLPMEVLLRESGGGAVLAGPWMLGLSLVLPVEHPWLAQGLVDSYRPLGRLCAEALNGPGGTVQALAPQQVQSTEAALVARGLPALQWACFGSLSPWELVDGQGRKLVGLAQRRRQTGVLLVAGILLAPPPWERFCAALGRAEDAEVLQQRTGPCVPAAGSALDAGTMAAALARGLEGRLG